MKHLIAGKTKRQEDHNYEVWSYCGETAIDESLEFDEIFGPPNAALESMDDIFNHQLTAGRDSRLCKECINIISEIMLGNIRDLESRKNK